MMKHLYMSISPESADVQKHSLWDFIGMVTEDQGPVAGLYGTVAAFDAT